MYSKVYSVNNSLEIPKEITIEAGLSGGLPKIQLLGDVSSKFVRDCNKFFFIFSNSGRKLPNKRIRILVTSDSDKKAGDKLDLAVFGAIYLVTNNLQAKEKCYFFGRISLSGEILSYEGIYKNLCNLYRLCRKIDEKVTVFIPNIDLPHMKNESVRLIRIENVSGIYDYFEGRDTHIKARNKCPSTSRSLL